jgi:tyrosyl-tRNA synthetase
MIGDPSGKSKTRPQLSREEVMANVESVSEQIYKILDRDKTEITYNGDWLGKMDFADVIRLAGRVTVARILEREDFRKRLDEEKPVGMHEILYPLCQGYDSVAINADVELGGTDQKFNNLVGRNLQGQYGQEPQVVMLMPLLVGLDGTDKMSQSLGNYIGITEELNEMFGKTMSITDSLMESWFTLCTDVPLSEVDDLIKGNPRDAKLRLAKEIVALYHGEGAGAKAEDYFIRTFSKREEPVDAPDAQIPQADGDINIARLIADVDLTASVGEARRLIEGGGVSIGGEKVTDPRTTMTADELDGKVLRVGKHKFRTLRK